MDSARALFANDAFYLAFAQRDLEAMDRLWARRHPVACIHPGWATLHERAAVMESWSGILANPDAPMVTVDHARALGFGDTVLVTCYERIGDQALAASNLFVLEDGEARLVHHQASPCAEPPAPELSGPALQ
ncbi:MAG: nuclear transport factor 2 family protein [Pseudomonadales bacterium]|jgi:hypothetical protein|nr:nuclear transport factor 2 family protein [Pseudomonadales bacterium]